ncbi:MAG: hypothetical protein ACWA6U_00530 [Breznakibacter sp.]
MIDYIQQLEPLLKGFWMVALPVSLIFIIQTILSFIGMDGADGTTADFDGDLSGGDAPFQLFSLRNLINFLLGFSWTGITFYKTIHSPVVLIAVAILVGVVFVLLFFVVIRQLQRLAEDNSFKMTDCLNKTAEVYVPIPALKKGKGRILISVKGSVHELDAMTDHQRLETGTMVKVVEIENSNILIVEKI